MNKLIMDRKLKGLVGDIYSLLTVMEAIKSKDEDRVVLQYIYYDATAKKLVAGDGFRMMTIEHEYFEELEEGLYEYYSNAKTFTLVKTDVTGVYPNYGHLFPESKPLDKKIELNKAFNVNHLQAVIHQNIGLEKISYVNPDLLKPLLKLGFKWEVTVGDDMRKPVLLRGMTLSGVKVEFIFMMVVECK